MGGPTAMRKCASRWPTAPPSKESSSTRWASAPIGATACWTIWPPAAAGGGASRLLLEGVTPPIGPMRELTLAHFTIDGDVLGREADSVALPLDVRIPVSNEPDPDPPPEAITSALSLISLYRLQEKARHDAELGQSAQAARRLENLATQLLGRGERELGPAGP